MGQKFTIRRTTLAAGGKVATDSAGNPIYEDAPLPAFEELPAPAVTLGGFLLAKQNETGLQHIAVPLP